MRITKIRLSNYRNIAFADLSFSSTRLFFQGDNGQGKTNLLEAVSLCGQLKSFRSRDMKQLIRHGQEKAGLFLDISGSGGNEHFTLEITPKGKKLAINQEKISRVSALMGRYPIVILCAEDMQLIRGGPAERRRFIDNTLSFTDPAYLKDLQTYQEALKHRNALLKDKARDTALYLPFEKTLAHSGFNLITKRQAFISRLAPLTSEHLNHLGEAIEKVTLAYNPDLHPHSPDDFASALTNERPKDSILQITRKGPHKDELNLDQDGQLSRYFASEGQQRSLALSLKLAQFDIFSEDLKKPPILLADDVLGQLDADRRYHFWKNLPHDCQCIATGTTPPESGEDWERFHASKGTFQPIV